MGQYIIIIPDRVQQCCPRDTHIQGSSRCTMNFNLKSTMRDVTVYVQYRRMLLVTYHLYGKMYVT